ncbi:hypothetical protein FRC08_016645, partial [Ceratobasidium sp. 394]
MPPLAISLPAHSQAHAPALALSLRPTPAPQLAAEPHARADIEMLKQVRVCTAVLNEEEMNREASLMHDRVQMT